MAILRGTVFAKYDSNFPIEYFSERRGEFLIPHPLQPGDRLIIQGNEGTKFDGILEADPWYFLKKVFGNAWRLRPPSVTRAQWSEWFKSGNVGAILKRDNFDPSLEGRKFTFPDDGEF